MSTLSVLTSILNTFNAYPTYVIYIYIYGAPSKARNLTWYIWTRFVTGELAS
jgi:hypothetical protein